MQVGARGDTQKQVGAGGDTRKEVGAGGDTRKRELDGARSIEPVLVPKITSVLLRRLMLGQEGRKKWA